MARNTKDSLMIQSDAGNKFLVPGPDDLDEADSSGVPFSDLCDPRSKYTPQRKSEAVAAMCLWGDSITAADKTGINANTIRWWKAEASWWRPVELKFRKEKNDELVGGYTRAIDTAMTHIEAALKGKPIRNKKTQEIIGYDPPSLRDLVMAVAIMQDKRSILLGEPTTINGKSTSETIKEVFQTFLEQSEELKKKRQPLIIEGERLE